MGENSAKEWFNELDEDVRLLLLIEDLIRSEGAPKYMLEFMHGMIKEKVGQCTMEFFILKDDSWRKYK